MRTRLALGGSLMAAIGFASCAVIAPTTELKWIAAILSFLCVCLFIECLIDWVNPHFSNESGASGL
jgi:hypothetical protein